MELTKLEKEIIRYVGTYPDRTYGSLEGVFLTKGYGIEEIAGAWDELLDENYVDGNDDGMKLVLTSLGQEFIEQEAGTPVQEEPEEASNVIEFPQKTGFTGNFDGTVSPPNTDEENQRLRKALLIALGKLDCDQVPFFALGTVEQEELDLANHYSLDYIEHAFLVHLLRGDLDVYSALRVGASFLAPGEDTAELIKQLDERGFVSTVLESNDKAKYVITPLGLEALKWN